MNTCKICHQKRVRLYASLDRSRRPIGYVCPTCKTAESDTDSPLKFTREAQL